MWDERYSRKDYVFGTEPNAFLASCAPLLAPGQSALCVADGEGRNSVWLAGQGLVVTAFDFSAVGIAKAKKLAAAKGVVVDCRQASIEDWDWSPDRFDVVAAIFIQFAEPALRSRIFEGMKRTLKPGGLLILQGYRPEQIEYATGGPRARENLYSRALLEDAFAGFDILRLDEHDSEIHEGPGHAGMSALIDLVARKPAA
jgi:2-polyprenyl-3-methyl-5-hydroxy-6-metoxy-1,4-benzoquinol methylase